MKPNNLHHRLAYRGLDALIPEEIATPAKPVLIYFEPELQPIVHRVLSGKIEDRFQWLDFTIRARTAQADHLHRWLNGSVQRLNHGLAEMKSRSRSELQQLLLKWRRWLAQLVNYWNHLVTLQKTKCPSYIERAKAPCLN